MDKKLREFLQDRATPGTRIEVTESGGNREYFDGRPYDTRGRRIGEVFRVIGLPDVQTVEEARSILDAR